MKQAHLLAVSVPAIVRVLDPMPLATLQGELESAAATAAASQAEFKRTSGLAAQDNSASRQALEAAQARAVADAASSAQLQRRLILEWTPALGRMTDDARQALVADLALGKAVLLRADAPTRPDGLEGRIQVSLEPGSAPVVAEPLGLGRTADPRMQTVGLFGVVRATVTGLPPGRVVAGSIETGEVVEGVVLPRSALVRLDGSVWAYVATGDDSFIRREVIDPEALDDGWFVTEGFPPGAQIVDRGAGSLVAVERNDDAATVD
jgi:hypothetical protein